MYKTYDEIQSPFYGRQRPMTYLMAKRFAAICVKKQLTEKDIFHILIYRGFGRKSLSLVMMVKQIMETI